MDDDLEKVLEHGMTKLVMLKTDLHDVEDFLEEKPLSSNNMLAAIEQRETQFDKLQAILPKLQAYESNKITQRCRSINNDRLFKAFITAFEQHNAELHDFKSKSSV